MCGDVMVTALVFRSEHFVVSLDKKLHSSLSLSTQVYKMVGGNPAMN